MQLAFNRAQAQFEAAKDRSNIALALARQSLAPLAWSIMLYFGIEYGSLLTRSFGPDFLNPLALRVTTDGYQPLIAAGVGAIATFLGLYYATVGVVASTVYGAVPAGIRTLFVSEPNGAVYVRGVAYTLMLGIALLTAGALGYRPTTFGLGAFAILTVVSVLRLLILGGRIFNFFDPTALSAPLPSRFVSTVRLASGSETSLRRGHQVSARNRAIEVLLLYRQLALLLDGRKSRDIAGPSRLTRQILALAGAYSTYKDRIPTESAWWSRTAEHTNWLTAEHTRLNAALVTSTGIPPKLVRDPLWVETEIADILRLTLNASMDARGSAGALAFADDMARAVHTLASGLHIEEALVLEQVWNRAIGTITASVSEDLSEMTEADVVANQLAAAEQVVMPVLWVWFGFVAAIQRIASQDLSSTVARALANPRELYNSGFPAGTVELLEELARKVKLEVEREGRRITPEWWINHLVARSIAQHLRAAHDECLATIGPRILNLPAQYIEAARFDLAASTSIAALELINKLDVHQATVESAFALLEGFRNSNTSLDGWTTAPSNALVIRDSRRRNHQYLSTALPHLRRNAHKSSQPDLYGQTYQILLSATFDAVLSGDADLAAQLFTALFLEVDFLRARLAEDLADYSVTTQAEYIAETLVVLMELSGYARLMQELDGQGIWETVQSLWDAAIHVKEPASTVLVLLNAIETVGHSVGFSNASFARSTRTQQFGDLMNERGLRRRDWADFDIQAEETTGNPIVEMFAESSYGGFDELFDLFVAEYLVERVPAGIALPRRTQSVVDSLHRRRNSPVSDFAGNHRHAPRTSPTAADEAKTDD